LDALSTGLNTMLRLNDSQVSELRAALDALAKAEYVGGTTQAAAEQKVLGLVQRLDPSDLLAHLDRAVRGSKRRRLASAFVLVSLQDRPEIQARVAAELQDPNEEWRSCLIQAIEMHHGAALAPLLNEVISRDPDSFCRTLAIHAAATLRQPVNLPVLLDLAGLPDPDLRLVADLGTQGVCDGGLPAIPRPLVQRP
jgi:hypothetical protein